MSNNAPLSPAEIAEIEARDTEWMVGFDCEFDALQVRPLKELVWPREWAVYDRRALLAHLRALESHPSSPGRAPDGPSGSEVEALKAAAGLIARMYENGPDCDCEPEGHRCGWPELRMVHERCQRALASRAPLPQDSAHHEYCDTRDPIIRTKPCNCPPGWPLPQDKGVALGDIAAERERQQLDEGWTTQHDDEHSAGELAMAAAAFAIASVTTQRHRADNIMPRNWDVTYKADDRRNLVIAGALLVAEIERLDRSAPPSVVAKDGGV